jgi:hypothetical protein
MEAWRQDDEARPQVSWAGTVELVRRVVSGCVRVEPPAAVADLCVWHARSHARDCAHALLTDLLLLLLLLLLCITTCSHRDRGSKEYFAAV